MTTKLSTQAARKIAETIHETAKYEIQMAHVIAAEYEPVMEVLREALEMECLRGRRVHCAEKEPVVANWCMACKAKTLFKLEDR